MSEEVKVEPISEEEASESLVEVEEMGIKYQDIEQIMLKEENIVGN